MKRATPSHSEWIDPEAQAPPRGISASVESVCQADVADRMDALGMKPEVEVGLGRGFADVLVTLRGWPSSSPAAGWRLSPHGQRLMEPPERWRIPPVLDGFLRYILIETKSPAGILVPASCVRQVNMYVTELFGLWADPVAVLPAIVVPSADDECWQCADERQAKQFNTAFATLKRLCKHAGIHVLPLGAFDAWISEFAPTEGTQGATEGLRTT